MIRPLPIRIEPAPDEAWHGYLRRAAAALGVQHPLSLLAPFLPTDRHATHGFRARRSIGIAARPETYERLGHHFHIEDHEIRGMFLERYATISSRWDAVDRERLDPLTHGEESTVWAPGPPPSFGPVAVRVVGFRLMGALPSVVDGCEVAER